MHNRRLAVTLVVLALVGTGCPSEPGSEPGPDAVPVESATAQQGGTVSFGVLGEPQTLDPYSPVASDLTYWLARPIFPSLYRQDLGGVVRRDLAASIVFSEGGATVVLEPRRWSDGAPVTARDVVASVRRARPPSGFARVRQARATGPRTVHLTGDVTDWEKTLATRAYVLPSGKARGLQLSAGPMAVTSRVPGLEIVYARNPEWEGDPPLLDRVRVQSIQSVEMMIALLERGKLDAAAVPSTVNIDERLDERRLAPLSSNAGETIVLDLEGAAPSRGTRAAIVRSIDREALAEGLIRDDGRLLRAPLPKAPSVSTRVAVQVAAPAGDELLQLMQRVIQAQLREHSIDAELVTIEPKTFYGDWERDDPTDVALRRRVGFTSVDGGTLDSFPLFEVDTVIAMRTQMLGLVSYTSLDGPLWDMERWSLVAASG